MKKVKAQQVIDDGDEAMGNLSDNSHFSEILAARYGRRAVLKGSVQGAIATMFGGSVIGGLAACSSSSNNGGGPAIGFRAVAISEADNVVVPDGYRASVIARWGEPITGSLPPYALNNSGEEQGMQIGSHHDGMHFFPIEGDDPFQGSSEGGLLIMNHEYVEPRYMHAAAVGEPLSRSGFPVQSDGSRNAHEVLKEMNAHGVSIVRVQKDAAGNWSTTPDALNRRVTGLTPMEMRGPVRGSDLVKTKYSPEGFATRGTLNNCAHGVTPWNTYLAAEENWAGYFRNRDEAGDPQPREHQRYGVRAGVSRYGWELADNAADAYMRFNAAETGASAVDDYRNEPNCFGWVVEIDPFDPDSTPQKRSALGRFAHEGVVFHPAREGAPVVCYSGDDARDEYIYKYLSAQNFSAATAGGHLLDDGTLYVAKVNGNGTGEWLALVHGENGLTEANGFSSQADVLVNTRLAADFVGATKMDRPEWGAVDPNTGQVYFTLTNNTSRAAEGTTPANPRGPNRHGHIIRWREGGGDPASDIFEWELFVVAGDSSGPDDLNGGYDLNGNPLTKDGIFSSPDGLWIDRDSRIWIQIDQSESVMNSDPDYIVFGNNSMLVGNPVSGEIRRFLTGPIGQEITGVITTPDQRTMFINVQHPGATTTAEEFAAGTLNGTWPDFDQSPSGYGRSATVVIQKEDGGIIGT